MGKKKIIGLCLAVGLMVGVVGGSLAWFTDSDTVTNRFSTQGNGDNESNGIAIVEKWNEEKGKNILPGTEVEKVVQVKNKASYDQYIRVKLKKVWKDSEGNEIKNNIAWIKGNKVYATEQPESKKVTLDDDLIELNFGEDNKNLGVGTGQWTDKTNDTAELTKRYYYYNGIVKPKELTNNLLESVTLSKDATSEYKNIQFDVIVDAEGIQVANGAAQDAWGYTPGATK